MSQSNCSLQNSHPETTSRSRKSSEQNVKTPRQQVVRLVMRVLGRFQQQIVSRKSEVRLLLKNAAPTVKAGRIAVRI